MTDADSGRLVTAAERIAERLEHLERMADVLEEVLAEDRPVLIMYEPTRCKASRRLP